MRKLQAAIFASCALCWPFSAFATDALPRAKPEAVGMSSERLALIRQRIEAEIARDQLPGGVLAIARRGKLVHFETYGYLDKAGKRADAHRRDLQHRVDDQADGGGRGAAALRAGPAADRRSGLEIFSAVRQAAGRGSWTPRRKTSSSAWRRRARSRSRICSGTRRGSSMAVAARPPVHKLYPDGSTPASDTHDRRRIHRPPGARRRCCYQPGTMWDYGFGLDVLGLIVEQLTEQSLGRYLQENVWKPLGMNDTHFLIPPTRLRATPRRCRSIRTPASRSRCARSRSRPNTNAAAAAPPRPPTTICASRSMLANKGTYDDQRILGRKTVEYMTANHLGARGREPDRRNRRSDPRRLRLRAWRRGPHPARHLAHDGLGRRLRLAGRQRHQLVGRSARRAGGGLDGALARHHPLALPADDQRAGLLGAGRLTRTTLTRSRITYVGDKFPLSL